MRCSEAGRRNGDPALLPADDEVDIAPCREVHRAREEALTGGREGSVAALDPELVDEDPVAGAHGQGWAMPESSPAFKGVRRPKDYCLYRPRDPRTYSGVH